MLSKLEEEGFTLIETLLSLVVVSIILFLPQIFSQPDFDNIETEWFLKEFENRLSTAQTYASVANRNIEMRFNSKSGKISFKVTGEDENPINGDLTLPDHMRIRLTGTHLFIINGGTGFITNFKRIVFTTPVEAIEYSFQLGGRYHVTRKKF